MFDSLVLFSCCCWVFQTLLIVVVDVVGEINFDVFDASSKLSTLTLIASYM